MINDRNMIDCGLILVPECIRQVSIGVSLKSLYGHYRALQECLNRLPDSNLETTISLYNQSNHQNIIPKSQNQNHKTESQKQKIKKSKP